jgi:hypothetical protein
MTEPDDIVARLRNETDDFRIFGLVLEAADEIERLRDQVTYWQALAILARGPSRSSWGSSGHSKHREGS